MVGVGSKMPPSSVDTSNLATLRNSVCPPGWVGHRGHGRRVARRQSSATSLPGSDPPPREGRSPARRREVRIASGAFLGPIRFATHAPGRSRRMGDHRTRPHDHRLQISAVANAAIFIGQETPCGPRADRRSSPRFVDVAGRSAAATKRDFLRDASVRMPRRTRGNVRIAPCRVTPRHPTASA